MIGPLCHAHCRGYPREKPRWMKLSVCAVNLLLLRTAVAFKSRRFLIKFIKIAFRIGGYLSEALRTVQDVRK